MQPIFQICVLLFVELTLFEQSLLRLTIRAEPAITQVMVLLPFFLTAYVSILPIAHF